MNKLSVVISAYNEESMLPACLESVSFADEIIVVNSSSTDDTVAIAKKAGARVFTRPNHTMLNINKNFGFEKATGDWILNLDADETAGEDLKKEIMMILENPKISFNGYQIPRKNKLFNKWIMHTGWYPDYQNRLFKKGTGRFAEKHVHEHIKIDGEMGTLNGHILHDSFRTISQFIKKHDLYSDNEAEQLLKNGYTFQKMDVIRMPKSEFMSRYFAREGYKDGYHGLVLSLLMAWYHLLIFLKIWEKESFKEHAISSPDIQHAVQAGVDEADHWFATTGGSRRNWITRKLRKLL